MILRRALSSPVLAILLVGVCASARAQTSDAADLSLEDLLKTEVVTVSRKAETLQATAAAAFVITRDDIERSGATSIPEALRLAPGLAVARMANNRWAVTARGFNGRFANKLLVLMDGRSIYSPLFSGVLWEVEDTLLEDVERIEVIRGPGASLWGTNAVNGVINIITRKARDTQGDLAIVRAGSAESAFAAYRHGGEVADGHYRLWGKSFTNGTSVDADGQQGNDTWKSARFGFRRDWSLASGQRFTLGGEAYGSPTGDRWNVADVASPQGFTTTDIRQAAHGGHLLGRREWIQDDGSESALQAYAEHGVVDVSNVLRESRVTLDLDFQRRLRLVDRHDLVWGLGYRWSTDRIDSQSVLLISPRERSFSLASAFVQDEVALLADKLRLIVGARLEHNSFTGWEPQPNLRMVWTPTPTQSVWSALSRAARTPSRAEQDAQIDLGVLPASPPAMPLPVLLRNIASPASLQQAEKVTTFELGYRRQLEPRLSLDLTAFYSDYRDLRSARLVDQQVVLGPVPYVLQEITPNSGVDARTHGFEAAVEWQPLPWWRLQTNYSQTRVTGRATSSDPINALDASTLGGTTPRHQFSLRSSLSFSERRQWDVWLRHVSELATIDEFGSAVPVPAYTALDTRFAWRPTPALELSLVGQNLLKRRHAEFLPDLLPSQALLVERSFYVKVKYQF